MPSVGDARFRVDVDTRKAQSKIERLTRVGRQTAARVGENVRRSIGRGFAAVGLVGAGAAAAAAIKQPSRSGLGDIAGETTAAIGAQLNEFLFGKLDEEARGARSARETTMQAFAAQAGRLNALPPGALTYFEQLKTLRTEEEVGKSIIREHTGFYDQKLDDLVDRLVGGLTDAVMEGAKYIWDRIRSFGLKRN